MRADGDYFIEDLGGKNGVFLNKEKIQRAQLHNLDKVIIPPFQLDFLAEEWHPDPEQAVVEIRGQARNMRWGSKRLSP